MGLSVGSGAVPAAVRFLGPAKTLSERTVSRGTCFSPQKLEPPVLQRAEKLALT